MKQGQIEKALEDLIDGIPSSERKGAGKKVHPIIVKFFDISVQYLNKDKLKEAIQKYRNFTQRNDVKSLRDAIDHLLVQSSLKMKAVLKGSPQDETSETGLSGEDMMLKAVDPESTWESKDEVGRCMRFHQEVLKQILKSIRQNMQLYDIYIKVAEEAIEFCKFHK